MCVVSHISWLAGPAGPGGRVTAADAPKCKKMLLNEKSDQKKSELYLLSRGDKVSLIEPNCCDTLWNLQLIELFVSLLQQTLSHLDPMDTKRTPTRNTVYRRE